MEMETFAAIEDAEEAEGRREGGRYGSSRKDAEAQRGLVYNAATRQQEAGVL